MKNKILTTVSLIALMGALPALAETVSKSEAETKASSSTNGNIAKDAKVAVKEIKKDTVNTYDKIKATLIGKNISDKHAPVMVETRKTANGMIGHYLYDENNEDITKITDIILDKDGKAIMLIASDSMMSIGTKAAFDYDAVTRFEKDGDLIIPATEEAIKSAVAFSYDKTEDGKKMRIIPDGGYSVARLLDGKLIDQQSKVIAHVDNVSFKNGKINHIIVGFNKVLGMRGDKAVLNFSDVKISRSDTVLNFQMNAETSNQFETYKKTLTK